MNKRLLKHEQVTADLLQRIRSGELKPGDHIPSERTLATYYGVSRLTTRRSLCDLEQRGLVKRDSHFGTILMDTLPKAKGETLTLLCSARPSPLIDEATHLTISKAFEHEWLARVIRVMPNDETPILEAIKLGNPTIIFGSPKDIWPGGKLERAITKAGPHIVIVGGRTESDDIPSVMRDDAACMHMAVQTLRDAGHTRIALSTPLGASSHPITSPQISAWRNLMQSELTEKELDDYLIALNSNFTSSPINTAFEGLKDYLCSPEAADISAMICIDEEIGTAAVAACEAVGRPVPDRMSILDYTWLDRTGFTSPRRIGIDTRMDKHIDIAIELLDKMLRGEELEHRHHRLAPRLIDGQSIVPFRQAEISSVRTV